MDIYVKVDLRRSGRVFSISQKICAVFWHFSQSPVKKGIYPSSSPWKARLSHGSQLCSLAGQMQVASVSARTTSVLMSGALQGPSSVSWATHSETSSISLVGFSALSD